MVLLNRINKGLGYTEKPRLSIGDTVSLQYESKSGFWSARKFTGICIRRSHKGFNERYTLRNVVGGVPVEFSFYRYWNLIIEIEKVGIDKLRKVRRGSLVFLRKKPLNASKVKG